MGVFVGFGFFAGLGVGTGIDVGYACGDKVLYKEYSGTTMKIDDEEFIVIKDEDIIAVSK